jgi:hypothetical protein
MNDPCGVSRGEAIAHLHGHIEQLARRIDRRDRRAFDELHDQVVQADIVKRADARMIQGGNRARLPRKAFTEFLVRGLDRDGAVEPRVARFVHLSHAARPKRREDFVGPEVCACRQGHRKGTA